MIQYFNAGAMTVALDLDRAETRQLILELATWVALSPANMSVGGIGEDGSAIVSTVAAMATIVDSKGVEHILNKVESRELCSKALCSYFSTPVSLAA